MDNELVEFSDFDCLIRVQKEMIANIEKIITRLNDHID